MWSCDGRDAQMFLPPSPFPFPLPFHALSAFPQIIARSLLIWNGESYTPFPIMPTVPPLSLSIHAPLQSQRRHVMLAPRCLSRLYTPKHL